MKRFFLPIIIIFLLIIIYLWYGTQNQKKEISKYHQPYYIALGDSLAAGMGVPPNMGYSDKYFNYLATKDSKTKYLNLGNGGDTTQNLLNTIQINKNELAKSTIITVHIGINDIFEKLRIEETQVTPLEISPTYDEISTNYNLIISDIKKFAPNAKIRVINYYNPFTEDKWFDAHIRNLNSIIKTQTAKNKLIYVDIYHLFKDTKLKYLIKENYDEDPIHPNLEGYKKISEELIKQ